jgi:hypothetical protein
VGTGPSGPGLLGDLKLIFRGDEQLETRIILDRLKELEEAPWGDLKDDKPLDARGLSWRLGRYGIAPTVIRFGERTARGYKRADFTDAWTRYLPAVRNSRNERNSAGHSVSDESVLRIDPKHENERNALTSDVTPVADVADTPKGNRVGRCRECGEPCDLPEGWHVFCAPDDIRERILEGAE